MRNKIKQYVLFVGLLLFVANITGVFFSLHILIEGGAEHHDSDSCPICQNTFVNCNKAISTFSATSIYANIIYCPIDYVSNSPIVAEQLTHLIPRAPPA